MRRLLLKAGNKRKVVYTASPCRDPEKHLQASHEPEQGSLLRNHSVYETHMGLHPCSQLMLQSAPQPPLPHQKVSGRERRFPREVPRVDSLIQQTRLL